MDLHQLLTEKREELLERWAAAAKAASSTPITQVELIDRMPRFISELSWALRASGEAPEVSPNAEEHGVQRLRLGFDIAEVVREYGLLHEAVLDLVAEAEIVVGERDAKVLASALNKGTRDAVVEYQAARDAELQRQSAEHIGFIAHEVRNSLASATMAFEVARRRAPEASNAIDVLGRALSRMREMIDNTLSQAWLRGGAPLQGETVDLTALLQRITRDVAIEADEKELVMTVTAEPITMHADARLLTSAVSNLVRNAVKFSSVGATIAVRARKEGTRILIEVADGCGGLPPGRAEELFSPFVQKGPDRSGFGLGLAIVRQAAEAHNGTVKVSNMPGHGCVFKLDLPAA